MSSDMTPSFAQLLNKAKKQYGNDMFLVRDGEHITFSEFYDRAYRIANAISPIKQNLIILSVEDAILFACAFVGGVISGKTICVSCPGRTFPETLGGGYVLSDAEVYDFLTYKSGRAMADSEENNIIVFSSGTTAAGKGVVLEARQLILNTAASARKYRYWQGERLLHILPYHHLFGLIADLIAPLCAGSQVYCPAHSVQAVRDIQRFMPDAVNMPPMFADVLCGLPSFPLIVKGGGGNLKKILCAGAPLSRSTANKLLDAGVQPCTAYGLTECGPCISIMEDDAIFSGSVGHPVDCLEIKIAEDKEILVRGDTVMREYYQESMLTANAIRDGWFHTGDLGQLNEKGELFVHGRKDTLMVFSDGRKISPEKIEQALMKLHGVAECLVQKDPDNQNKVRIIIVCDKNIKIEREQLQSVLSKYALPAWTVICQDEALPKNQLGKVLRRHE